MSEIVLIMGYNAAGKSTLIKKYTDDGYTRFNRDDRGGKVDTLAMLVAEAHAKGTEKFVLDNTYPDPASRKAILDVGKAIGVPVRCVWLSTPFEDAQFNACQRMIRMTGKLLMPEDFKTEKNPNLFPPAPLFVYKKNFKKPTMAEGFSAIEEVKFVRQYDPAYNKSALIFDCDGVFRDSIGAEKFPCCPAEIKMIDGRADRVREEMKKYDYLLGVSNQSGVAKKKLTMDQARACFDHTNKMLGLDIEWHFCPHNIPPVTCYCRKPHPGLGVLLIEVQA